MSESALGKASSDSTQSGKGVTVDCKCRLENLPDRKYRNKEWLKHQYRHLEKSARAISREFGYGDTTINTWIDKHDIQKRKHGEIVSTSQNKGKEYDNKEWLQEKYYDEGMTLREVADVAGVSRSAIRRAMKANGVEIRDAHDYEHNANHNHGPWDDEDWLRMEYVEKHKSVPEISQEYDVSTTCLYSRLKEFGIDRREYGTKGKIWLQERPYTQEEYLIEEYVKKERSAKSIGDDFGVSSDTIYHWMDRHGIERRERKDRTGDLAPNWKGGFASDYGSNWKRMRDRVRKRDNHTCQDCGHEWVQGETRLDVHHITPIKKFDQPEKANTLENLITLCRTCHNKWEGIPLRPDTHRE